MASGKEITMDWEKFKIFVKNLDKSKNEMKMAYVCGSCGTFIEDEYAICALHKHPKVGRVCSRCYRGINYQYAMFKTILGHSEKNPEVEFTSDLNDSIIVLGE